MSQGPGALNSITSQLQQTDSLLKSDLDALSEVINVDSSTHQLDTDFETLQEAATKVDLKNLKRAYKEMHAKIKKG